MKADADRPGWRTREKRREQDRAFLAWLTTATKLELAQALRTTLPEWRRVAVQRRLTAPAVDATPKPPNDCAPSEEE